MGVELTKEQRQAVEDRGGQLLVSAAAGSGKTRVLVERLLGHMDRGADIDQFLVITYTNAAAAELRGKVMDALLDRIAQDPADLRLRREVGLAGRAHIETIHSFCAGVLRENAHALGLTPDFRVADEQEARVMKESALADLLDKLYDEAEPDFLALADTVGAGRDDRSLVSVILDTHVKLMSHPDPAAWADRVLEALALEGVTDAAGTPWGRVIMDRARDAAVYWREQMEYLVDEAAADEKLEKGYGNSFRATFDSLGAFIKALSGAWDEAREAAAIDFPTGRVSGYDDLKAVRTACKKAMDKVAGLFWDDSERALGDMRRAAPALRALLRTVLRFDEAYSQVKRRRGLVDFADQEHLALKLLSSEGQPTEAAGELSRRFVEIMVDEYQDVNEIQETILNAVSREGRNIFAVGDVKQSIYRFRLADPTIFLRKYMTFADAEKAGEGEPRRVILSRNFRSRPGILDAANFLFQNLMSRRLGDLDYGPREQLYPGLPDSGCPEPPVELDVIDLKRPDGADDEDEAFDSKSQAEALFTARRIRELMATAQIPDGEGGLRNLRYGDFAVLMRSPRSALPVWQQVFAGEGIPLAADQPTDFFAEHEVSLMLSLLEVIDNPRQDIPLVSVLGSPIYGVTPEELAEIRLYDREGDFWSALVKAGEEREDCGRFLRDLAELRAAAPDMTADELLWTVYDVTGIFALVSAMEDGQVRRENLMLLLELARSYEGAGYKGLFGFLTYIRALRERGAGPESSPRKAENAVTLMSIHKSKGLEFPVVFLAELVRRFNTEDTRARMLIHPELGPGPKLTDTERRIEYYTLARRAVAERLRQELLSEELRVLYVAVTRPQQKLIMLTSHMDAERDLSKLMNAPLPVPPELAGSCRSMAEWVLMPALRRPESTAIRFGQPNVPCDTEGTPWVVRLITGLAAGETAEPSEVRQERETAQSVSPELREALDYVYPYAAAAAMPSKVTATELTDTYRAAEAAEEALRLTTAPEPEPSPESAALDLPPRRPAFMEGRRGLTGAERGTAVHIVMQYADYARCRTREGAAAEVERLRLLGTITEEQARAVRPEIIADFFQTEPGQLILGAPVLRRELKFSLLVDSGDLPGFAPGERILLQGVVDCCVEEPDGLTVIDFKTDRVTPDSVRSRAEHYAPQLAAYALAMERVLHKRVKRRVLCFLTAGLHVEV